MIERIRKAFGIGGNTAVAPVTKGNNSTYNESMWTMSRHVFKQYSTESEAYRKNVWVFRSVQVIATAIAGVSFFFRSKNGKNDKVEDLLNPWVRLFNNPNPLLESQQLMKLTSLYYELYGQCFWILYDINMNLIAKPTDIPYYVYALSPRQVLPRYRDGNIGLLAGWNVIGPKGEAQPVEFWQCTRFFEIEPRTLVDGMSPIHAAGVSIETDDEAHKFNRNFFENGGKRESYLSYTGDAMDDDELRSVRDEFDLNYSGTANAHKTPILSGGFDLKNLGETLKDMDFGTLLKMTREEIVSAFGVPKHKVSLYEDINYATAQIMDVTFWTDNIIPKLKIWQSVINHKMLQYADVELHFDFSEVEALVKTTTDKLSAAKQLFDLGYPLDEINDKLNLTMDTVGETWSEDAVDARVKPTPAIDPTTMRLNLMHEEILQLNERLSARSSTPEKSLTTPELQNLIGRAWQGDTEATHTLIESYHKEVTDPDKDKFEKAVSSTFSALCKAQLSRLDQVEERKDVLKAALTREDLNTVLFNNKKWGQILQQAAEPFHRKAWERSIDRLNREIGGFVRFNSDSADVSAALRETNVDIAGVTERMQEAIRETLAEGVDNKESGAELRNRVKAFFDAKASRVQAIVDTETNIAASRVRYAGMKIERMVKKWTTAHDDHVREKHQSYGAMPTESMTFEYAKGLKHPHDTDCDDAGEIVNCRCVLIAKRAN